MTVPTVNAVINFSTGPSFAQAMILGSGILDTNVLADSASVIVDVSNVVDSIQTIRGRNAQADQFQTGTLSLRIVDQNGDFNPNQNRDRNYTNNVINVNAGVIGDENIIVDAVQNAMNEIARRGYLTTYAGAIAV